MDGEQPTRVVGHTIEVSEEDVTYAPANGIEAALAAKLAAEEARLWRLLPDPPAGHHWEFDIQQHEELPRNAIYFRVVAKLEKDA